MKHLEYFGHWYDKLLNSWPFLLDDTAIQSQGLAIGFIEDGQWHFKPRVTGNAHQYFNALLFIRLTWPVGLFLHIRLSKNRLLQCGIGYKLTGRFAIHCRLQSDESSAKGYHEGLPNTDHVSEFNYGPH